MRYRLYAVRVFSQRWEDSVAFYRDVLEWPEVFSDSQMGWAQFDLGGPCLGVERCAPNDAEAAALVGRFVGVSIAVEDIGAAYETLRARGVEFVGPPEEQSWGGVLAHFRDPDGNVLTLLGGGS